MMKVSIITATYNSEKTLRNTIDSVLYQSYKNIEYIVVDGASKDSTLDIVKSYENLFDGRLRYVSEKDSGLYDAMNKGIRMASGDVIGILNSDDFLSHADAITWVVQALEESNADAVYGDIHYVDDADLSKCVRYYSSKIFKRGLMRLGFMPAHPSFYCKAEVYREKGIFDLNYKQAADFELLLRLIYCGKIRIYYISKDFVTMRTGGLSTSGLKSHKAIMKDHYRALKCNHVYSNYFLLGLRYVYKVFELVKSNFIKVETLPDYITR